MAHIPTHILQGALDFCCPPAAAYALHVALPKARFRIIPMCGHWATPAMNRARKAAIKKLAKLK
jgi:proline iminopeptidase